MYCSTNFKSKKLLKEAVANGKAVTLWQPGPFGGNVPTNGEVSVEGPHYPKPHSWYARVTLQDGKVVKVK